MKDLFKFVPQKKTGIKLLSEAQMKSNFSSYDSLIDKIESYRNMLSKIALDDMMKEDDQFALMYDMVFSIFGERGSGKTSVAFTLKQERKQKNPEDIILPMIMPEVIPDGQHVLSWILENLDSTICKIEESIKTNPNLIYDTEYFTNCKFKTLNPLRKQYERVRRDCYLLIENIHFENTFESNISNKIKRGKYSSELTKELSKFWSILIEAQKKIYKTKEPLIYLIFDDVDLAPNRILEIFNTTVKYLSYPNIIVIVTAEEKLLNQVVEKYLREFIYNQKNEDNVCLLVDDIANRYNQENYLKKLVLEYINKVLPPSNQYYIDSYNSCRRKMDFILTMENDDDKGRKVKDLLIELVKEYIQSRNVDTEGLENANFLLWKDEFFIATYLKFWGKTSRQIATQYLIVEELIKQLIKLATQKKSVDLLKEEIYRCIYHFLYRTLLSKGLFNSDKKKIELFLERIWKYKYDQWDLFINYPFIREVFEQKQEIYEIDVEDILDLLIMLFFIENLLIIWNNGEDKINHGDKVNGEKTLIYILDKLTPGNYSLVKRSENGGINEILYHYEKILEDISRLTEFNIFSNIQVKELTQITLKGERKFIEDGTDNLEITNKLYNWSTSSPKWFKTIIKLLYFRYENIFEINSDVINVISLEQKNLGEDIYTHNKILELENEVVDTLSNLYKEQTQTGNNYNEKVEDISNLHYNQNFDLNTLENEILKMCGKDIVYEVCKSFLEQYEYQNIIEAINNIETTDIKNKNQLIEENNNIIYNLVSAVYEILYYKFKVYDIKKKEQEDHSFIKKLEKKEEGINNEEISLWCAKIKSEFIDSDYKSVTVETFQNLIVKIKWYMDDEVHRESMTGNTKKLKAQQITRVRTLSQFLRKRIFIKLTEKNFETAKKYIALFQVLKQVIRNFLKNYSKLMTDTSGEEENSYKELYSKMKEILKEESSDMKQNYISTLIKNNINELMLDYVHYVKHRIEGDNIHE